MIGKELSRVYYIALEIIGAAILFGIVAVFGGYTRQADEAIVARWDAMTDMVEYRQLHTLVGDNLYLVSQCVEDNKATIEGYYTSSGEMIAEGDMLSVSDTRVLLGGTYPDMSLVRYTYFPQLNLSESTGFVSYDEIVFFLSKYPDVPFVLVNAAKGTTTANSVPVTYRLLQSYPSMMTINCPEWEGFVETAGIVGAKFKVLGVFDDVSGGPALLICAFTV